MKTGDEAGYIAGIYTFPNKELSNIAGKCSYSKNCI